MNRFFAPVSARFSKDVFLHIAGICSLVTYLFLAYFSDSPYVANLNLFYCFVLILAIIYWITFTRYFRSQSQPHLGNILFWAILFRLVGLWGEPLYEDDFYRYLWDGFQFYQSGNPYSTSPSDFFPDHEIPYQFQEILNRINYPTIPTVYAPTFQYSFLLGHLLTPGHLLGLKLIYVATDISLMIILSKVTSNRLMLYLYAWCPLVIKEIAFTAHPDGFGVFFLVMTYFCLLQKHFSWCMVFLALSICAKPFAWLIAPFILVRIPRNQIAILLLAILILYLPFLLTSATDIEGLLAFGKNWEFNAAVFALLQQFFSSTLAKAISFSLFLCFYLSYLYRYINEQHQSIRVDWIITAALLCSPVINAWYWLWVLPFAVLHTDLWIWVASFCLFLSYATGFNTNSPELGDYQLHSWVPWVEYSVILAAFLWERKSGKFSDPA